MYKGVVTLTATYQDHPHDTYGTGGNAVPLRQVVGDAESKLLDCSPENAKRIAIVLDATR